MIENKVNGTVGTAVSGAPVSGGGNKNAKELNARLLEPFWKLTEYDQSTRIDGTVQLITYFKQLSPEKDKDSYQYVLNRLVKGLASNRKCSRLGFSCCLTELMNSTSVKVDDVIQLAKSYLSSSKKDAMLTKEELRHMHVGFVFVYLSWIQSNRLQKADTSFIKQALNDLNEMRKKPDVKTYIQELYLQAMIQLVKKIQVSDEVFASEILPCLKSDLAQLWTNESTGGAQEETRLTQFKSNLNLLLVCLNKHHEVTSKYLRDQGHKLKSVFSEKHLDLLFDMISQSSESLPQLQPVCLELINYLVEHNISFLKQLWSDLLNAKLGTRKEPEKKLVCFKLYLHTLKLVTKDNVSTLFDEILIQSSGNILQSFAQSYAYRAISLNQLCRVELGKELAETSRDKETTIGESHIGAELCIKLIHHTKNLHDISDLTNSLVAGLSKTSLNKLFEFLISDMLKLTEVKSSDDDEKQLETDALMSRQLWLVNQLCHFARNKHTLEDTGLAKRLLRFLSNNAYFDSVGKKNQVGAKLTKNDKLVESIRECLLEYAGVLLNNRELYSLIIESIEYIHTTVGDSSAKLNEKLAKKETELKELCVKIVQLLKSLLKKVEAGGEATDVFNTFFMIVTIEFFRMFDSIKNSKQVVDDIEICVQKFEESLTDKTAKSKKKKEKKTETNGEEETEQEAEWIDVLVEMLLNLFTINKNWIRNAIKTQFKKLMPRLTVNSVKLIIDLLDPEAEEDLLMDEDEDEAGMQEDVDDDKDQDLFLAKKSKKREDEESKRGIEDGSLSPSSNADENSNGKKRKREEVEKVAESEESDDDDDEDENAEIDEDLKSAVMKVLGGAAATGSDDDESDLDDDTMLKLDETLAQAFKMRKKGKEHQKEIMQYKLRALDFLQELFKSSQRLDLITYLIKPMLDILFESQTKPNLKFISQRILGFLMNLKNTAKKLNESQMPTVEDLFELLNHIIQCSTIHFNVSNTLIETSMFFVRLILHISNSSTDKTVIHKRLNDIYSDMIKNDKKINPNMYKEYLIRYPANSIPLAIQIIDNVLAPDVKLHKKTVTLITLYQCINSQMFVGSESSSEADSFVEKIFIFFDRVVDDIIKDENVHVKFVDAFLNLANRVINLPKSLYQNKSQYKKKLADKLSVVVKESKVKHAYKSRFLNLINMCSAAATTAAAVNTKTN